MQLTLRQSHVMRNLIILGALFAIAGVVSALCAALLGTDRLFPGYRFFVTQFDLDSEGNLPTWYQSILLFICSVLLATIGMCGRSGRRAPWYALSGVFLLMSMDEICAFHNKAGMLIPDHLATSGFLHFQWVVIGALAVLLTGLLFLRFLRSLPRRTRLLFILAGALYVGGALVMEIIEGPFAAAYGYENLLFRLLAAGEESLEMAGLTLFIYALLRHIRVEIGALDVRLAAAPERATQRAAQRPPAPASARIAAAE